MVLNILRSRKFAKRVLIILLILIIPAFVLWGVGNLTGKPQPIGVIRGHKITPETFVQSRQGMKVQVLLTYFGNYEAMMQMLRNRSLMNFMTWERLILLDAARENKIKVTNDEVLSFISQHPLFKRQGVFDRNLYSQILRNNLSIGQRQFEEFVRENLQISKLRQQLLSGVDVTDSEVAEAYSNLNDKIDVSYLLIESAPFSEEVTVTEEEVRSAYEKNKDKIVVPEMVQVEYLELPFQNEEQKTEAIKAIQEIYPDLKKSPDEFQKTVEAAGINYGKTKSFSKQDVVQGVPFFQDFHNAAFSLSEGEISVPIFSAQDKGSIYVLRKTGYIPSSQMSFEEAEKDIKAGIVSGKTIQLAKKIADPIYVRLSAGETTLEEEAGKLNQEAVKSGPVGREDYIEGLGPAGKMIPIARENGQGKIIEPLFITKGVVITRVDEIIPASAEDLTEEKKEQLRKDLLLKKQISVMDKWFKVKSSESQLTDPLDKL